MTERSTISDISAICVSKNSHAECNQTNVGHGNQREQGYHRQWYGIERPGTVIWPWLRLRHFSPSKTKAQIWPTNMDRVRSKTIPSGNSYVHLFFHLKTLGFSRIDFRPAWGPYFLLGFLFVGPLARQKHRWTHSFHRGQQEGQGSRYFWIRETSLSSTYGNVRSSFTMVDVGDDSSHMNGTKEWVCSIYFNIIYIIWLGNGIRFSMI